MTPDWVLQLMWFVAGVSATGAIWYFLAQKNRYALLWAIYFTVVIVLLAVALHIRNDLIRRDATPGLARPITMPAALATSATTRPRSVPHTPTPTSAALSREATAPHPPVARATGIPGNTSVPPVVVNAPGGVVSVGQQGGITAKEVTIHVMPRREYWRPNNSKCVRTIRRRRGRHPSLSLRPD
jgi:hypothetical protein